MFDWIKIGFIAYFVGKNYIEEYKGIRTVLVMLVNTVCETRCIAISGRTPLQPDRSTLHHPVKECLSVLSQRGPCTVLFCLCKWAVFYDEVFTPKWKNFKYWSWCVWLKIIMWHYGKEVVMRSIVCLFRLKCCSWTIILLINIFILTLYN